MTGRRVSNYAKSALPIRLIATPGLMFSALAGPRAAITRKLGLGHPQRQQGLQSYRAGIAPRLPDRTQDGNHPGTVTRRTGRRLKPSARCQAEDRSADEWR